MTGYSNFKEMCARRGGVTWDVKFGRNADVDATEESIVISGGAYAYPASAVTATISSSNSADVGQTIQVWGLDEDWLPATRTGVLNGQNGVSLDGSLIRFFRARNLAAAGAELVGDLYVGTGDITSGVPATVYAKIAIGKEQTQLAIRSVPAGMVAYCPYLKVSTFGTGSTDVIASLYHRDFGGTFHLQEEHEITEAAPFIFDSVDFPMPGSSGWAEKSDIEIRASAGASNSVSASFVFVMLNKGIP